MRIAALVWLVSALALTSPPATAGDAVAGRQKALQCQGCHGLDGLSKMPGAPHLAGQPVEYLTKALDEFRKGVRQNEMMSVVARMLADADIQDLAAYYGGLEITVKMP